MYWKGPSAMNAIHAAGPKVFEVGLAPDWRRYSFDWQAGRPAAIVVAQTVAAEGLRALLDAFARQSVAFAERNADVLVLAAAEQGQALRGMMSASGCIGIVDCDDAFLAASGAQAGEIMVVVVDRNLRVSQHCAPGAAEDVVADCLVCLEGLVREMPAPVVMLPNLLPRSLCRTLIERFESGAHSEGRMVALEAIGMTRAAVEHGMKNRRDLQIQPDDPLHAVLREILLTRCAPEIAKAFSAEIGHTDRLMLVRYDSPSGWFGRQRGGGGESVALRDFALSVTLNAEEHKGGYLTFPEYNDQPFAAPTGAGVIFSTSVLHEVAPVRSGRRYTLLACFRGEAAALRRQMDGTPEAGC
jgi:predicted 2-oxoglutarate/Fe(II)-dependent dioxygenase YbiX